MHVLAFLPLAESIKQNVRILSLCAKTIRYQTVVKMITCCDSLRLQLFRCPAMSITKYTSVISQIAFLIN